MPVRLVVFLVSLIICAQLYITVFIPYTKEGIIILSIVEFFLMTIWIIRWGKRHYLEEDNEFEYKCGQCGRPLSKDEKEKR